MAPWWMRFNRIIMHMNKKLAAVVSSAALLALPALAFAGVLAPPPLPNTTVDVWGVINKIIGFIWPIFFGVAIVMFLISGFMFLTAAGDPNKIKLGRDALIWGIVGVLVGVLSISIPYIVVGWFG